MKLILGALAILGAGAFAVWYLNRPGGAAAANAGVGGVNPPVGGAPGPSICQALLTTGGTVAGAYNGVPPQAGSSLSAALAKPLCEMGPIVGKIASGIKSGAEATAHAIGFGASKTFEATTKATIAAAKATGTDKVLAAGNDLAHLRVGAAATDLTKAAAAPVKFVAGFAPKPVEKVIDGAAGLPTAVVSGGVKLVDKGAGVVASGAKAVGSAGKSVAKKLCFWC